MVGAGQLRDHPHLLGHRLPLERVLDEARLGQRAELVDDAEQGLAQRLLRRLDRVDAQQPPGGQPACGCGRWPSNSSASGAPASSPTTGAGTLWLTSHRFMAHRPIGVSAARVGSASLRPVISRIVRRTARSVLGSVRIAPSDSSAANRSTRCACHSRRTAGTGLA